MIINPYLKLLPNSVKKQDTNPRKGELLYVVLYCSLENLLTCGYGHYKGLEIPKDLTVLDWDVCANTTGKKFDYVKLTHNNKKVYSCEGLFVRPDTNLDTLIKNRIERYIDIDSFRFMHFWALNCGKKDEMNLEEFLKSN